MEDKNTIKGIAKLIGNLIILIFRTIFGIAFAIIEFIFKMMFGGL